MHHLPKTKSNHCPIPVKMDRGEYGTQNHPFRFQLAWFTHDSFDEIMDQHWRGSGPMDDLIAKFTRELGVWNREISGNIFIRKRKLLAKLNGVQIALGKRYS